MSIQCDLFMAVGKLLPGERDHRKIITALLPMFTAAYPPKAGNVRNYPDYYIGVFQTVASIHGLPPICAFDWFLKLQGKAHRLTTKPYRAQHWLAPPLSPLTDLRRIFTEECRENPAFHRLNPGPKFWALWDSLPVNPPRLP